MKILGIEIGNPEPYPVSLAPVVSAAVEIIHLDPNPELQKRVEWLEEQIVHALTLSSKWEQHLTQSQAEKYRYVELYEATKKELDAAKRLLTFREAQIEGLKRTLAKEEEPKLPRTVSHKPAQQS